MEKKLRSLSYSVEKLKEELAAKETLLVIERRGKESIKLLHKKRRVSVDSYRIQMELGKDELERKVEASKKRVDEQKSVQKGTKSNVEDSQKQLLRFKHLLQQNSLQLRDAAFQIQTVTLAILLEILDEL